MELRRQCFEVTREFRHSLLFAGLLVFGKDQSGFTARFLHNHTALDLLQSLQAQGLSLVILPVRVTPVSPAEAVPQTVAQTVPG